MDTIQERIKAVRKSKGLTQQAFADKLGLKQNTIATYEMGKTVPSDRTISDICEKFSINEEWLRTGTGEPCQKETRQEQIMRFAEHTVKGSDEFRKSFVSMLAKMDVDDWKVLEELFENLSKEIEKNRRSAPVVQKNMAAARSGDRMEAANVTKEEEDAVLPPPYTGNI